MCFLLVQHEVDDAHKVSIEDIMHASGAVEMAVQQLAQSWKLQLQDDTQRALFVTALLDEVAAEEDLYTLYDPEFDLITNSANLVSHLCGMHRVQPAAGTEGTEPILHACLPLTPAL